MRSILDFRPVHQDDDYIAKYGAEPSLRELIYRYYSEAGGGLTEEKAIECAKDYCNQIEAQEGKKKS